MVRRKDTSEISKQPKILEHEQHGSTWLLPDDPQQLGKSKMPQISSQKRQFDPDEDIQAVELESNSAKTTAAALEDDEPSPKRHRGPEWPLKNDPQPIYNIDGQKRAPTLRRKKSFPKPDDYAASTRPSKFMEGSLNDKPSNTPPHEFLGDEELLEAYNNEKNAAPDQSMVIDESKLDTQRPSSLVRFGRLSKVFASVFNPITAWHGMGASRKERDVCGPPDSSAKLEERKAKAESAYAELKKAGHKGTKPPTPQAQIDQHAFQHGPDDTKNFRDSAIEMYDRPSMDLVEGRRSVDVLQSARESIVTPAHETSSRRVPSMTFQPASLDGLKKVKSHVQLPKGTRHSSTSSSRQVSNSSVGSEASSQIPQPLQRQHSRKDLMKQQKLSKRVSDLESKLELARWELEQSLQNAPKVPEVPPQIPQRKFIPGALPSLPSERLLNSNAGNEPAWTSKASQETQSGLSHHSASVPNATTSLERATSPSSQLCYELVQSALQNESTKGTPTVPTEHSAMTAAGNASRHRRQKARAQNSIDSVLGTAPALSNRKNRLPNPPGNTPFNSPGESENVPVVPAITKPANVLYEKPLVAHPLDKPAVTLPPKTKPRTSSQNLNKRGISPPPPSLASTKKTKKPRVTFLLDDEADSSPNRQRENSSSSSQGSKGAAAGSRSGRRRSSARLVASSSSGRVTDKPLPEIQREEYEWDEDVF